MDDAATLDARLLAQATAVSVDERLTELFEAHQARLFRTALRLSRTREDAQDLVQETFVRAARRIDALPPVSEAEGWLVRTLVNLCRDSWRRRAVRERPVPDWPANQVDGSASSSLARITVRSALQKLSPMRRAIVALVDLEGLTSREAARLLGVRPATVRWHRSKAHAQLARLLTRTDQGIDDAEKS